MRDTPTGADARAIELIGSSRLLNPDLTLDKLMHIALQLAELETGIRQDSGWKTFIHNAFMFTTTF
jgi:hypothetical protein